jgi:hypothetical protein
MKRNGKILNGAFDVEVEDWQFMVSP